MVEQAVIYTEIEPGVIVTEMIRDAFREQGPKGVEGELMEEECYDIHTTPCKELRLEFLNILRIDHLWMLTGLTKLQLSNNIIEKIENLNELVNLVELDLSFNRIGKIENVETLVNLEVFTLYKNKIKVLENMDNLKKIEMFSIGQNEISDIDCVLYLRKFKNLKGLNMAGNPCADCPNFKERVAAFIPHLIYYQYTMITSFERDNARNLYLSELERLEQEEKKIWKVESEEIEKAEKFELHKTAFVENLDSTQLFDELFANDPEGQAALMTAQEAEEIFDGFREHMTEISKALFNLGMQQVEVRKEEIRQFQYTVNKTKISNIDVSRRLIEDFLDNKSDVFYKTKRLLKPPDTPELGHEKINKETIDTMVTSIEDLTRFSQELWAQLMKNELTLFEQIEDLIAVFERNLIDLISTFIEQAQGYFTQMREQESTFMELITEHLIRFQTKVALRNEGLSEYPVILKTMMADKDSVHAGMAASHDVHGLVIDGREDLMISRLREWHQTLCINLVNEETKRNRTTITEISHFIDCQRDDLDNLYNETEKFYDMEDDVLDTDFRIASVTGADRLKMERSSVASLPPGLE